MTNYQPSPFMSKIMGDVKFVVDTKDKVKADLVCVFIGEGHTGNPSCRPSDFRDGLSRKEFTISGMCQACQDDVFGGE